MDDDPVPFRFPAQQPFHDAPQPPAEEFREPKRKRGRPRKVEGKKRGPKPGSKRKPKAVFEAELERRGETPPPYDDSPAVQRSCTFSEMTDALNKVRAALNVMPPTQRKELLTYLLGQQ